MLRSHDPSILVLLETRTRCTVADKISNKAQLSKVIKIDAQGAGIWLFWRDDGMKIDLVSSNFRASNCLVYEGGKAPGLDEVLRIESRKGFVRQQCEIALRSFS